MMPRIIIFEVKQIGIRNHLWLYQQKRQRYLTLIISGHQGSVFHTFCSSKDRYLWCPNLLNVNNNYNCRDLTSKIFFSQINQCSTIMIFVNEFIWITKTILFDVISLRTSDIFCFNLYQRCFIRCNVLVVMAVLWIIE